MSNELKAILEYDAARLEIIRLGHAISESTVGKNGPHAIYACTSGKETPCFELLWTWNKENSIYEYWLEHASGFDSEPPTTPDGEEPPELCECCKVTQSLVDARKAAKKRFGIAKARLSRIARDHRNKTEQEAIKAGAV